MPKRLTFMFKPASSLCDLRCAYCFYADEAATRAAPSVGMMSRETADACLRNVYAHTERGDEITFAFQGGEPTLAGLDFFEHFASEAKRLAPAGVRTAYALQTNGLHLDDAWCAFLKAHGFLVGLSLDGDAVLHNRNRADARGKSTHARVLQAKKRLDRHAVPYNVLCVLTAEHTRRAGRLFAFFKAEGVAHVQFIPCLEPLAGNPAPQTLTGTKFFRFYSDVYTLWRADPFLHVRFFEDILGLFVHGRGITCGISGHCMPQWVIEADGTTYPCDFYCLDGYAVGNLAVDTLETVYANLVASEFFAPRPLPDRCAPCRCNRWCGGGCKRMANVVYGEDCGVRMFLDAHLEDLLRQCVSA